MKTRLVQLYPGLPRSLHTGAALVLCSTFLACIGATPLPKRTRTPEGTEVKSVDLTFIHPGQTTRDEVRQKLKIIDTGYEGDHFFLGRWSSSTWGGWMVAVGIPPGGFGGGGRVWKSGNLLVEFDDAGVVKRSEPFDDRKSIRVLTPVAANTPLHLTPPLELDLKFWETVGVGIVSAKIVLSPGRLDFEELGDRKNKYKFSLPAKDVLRVETPITAANTDPTYSGYRLRCAHDLKKVGGPHSRDINLALTLPQTVTLMTYVSQAKSAPDSAASATNGNSSQTNAPNHRRVNECYCLLQKSSGSFSTGRTGEDQCNSIAPLRTYLRHDHRYQGRVCVREMAHVRVKDIAPDEPAHRSSRNNVRSEVFLCCDSRRAHDASQAVRGYADDFLVLEFVIEQRGNRPYLNRVTGRK